MNLQSFKNRNGLIILVSVVVAILIYSIDFFKLDYQMTGWKQFGDSPVAPARIQYFVADTPNLIGFKDISGENVSCAETVAYVETEAQENFRCCDTGGRIACMAGDFPSDIPPAEEACVNSLQELFDIPISLAGTRDYKVFGVCSGGSQAEVTVAQIDGDGQILWKFINVNTITVLNSALKYLLGPALLGLAGWIIFTTLRGNTYRPVRMSQR